ncbi:MAG TPA: diacylglycerol kinase family protein [Patescibacteria group bacterium]|nr:diacylglycerol kinase family protein [Patescibacteria group bacterium]
MILFIFNPEAKRAQKLKTRIKNALKELKISGEFVEVEKKDDLKTIVPQALERGYNTIVTIGGDGMINRVIPYIMNTEVSLGIIPIGETNLLANIIGIKNWREGCESLINSKTIPLGIGIVNDRLFLSTVEIEVKQENNKKIFGLFSSKIKKKYLPVSINIEAENTDVKIQSNMSSIFISTIPIPPPRDFKIENEVENQNLNIIVKSKPTSNSKKNNEEITILHGKKIDIQSKSSLVVKADGDPFGKTPAYIEMITKSLKVIIP